MIEGTLNPSLTLLCKLASIVVHIEEKESANGHAYDKVALDSALNDPEVKLWVEQMTSFGFAPVKR